MSDRIGKALRDAAGLALYTGVCAGTGAMLGAAAYFYKQALVPQKRDLRMDEDPQEKEYVAGRKWVREHPMREDVYTRSDDALQLHAVFIPSERKDCRTYAVCVHGYADGNDSMGIYARRYRDWYGMHVLLPDLRGHGRSDGNYVGMGHDESMDLLRWIDWIIEREPDARIILHGISMGAATVLMTTGLPLPAQVMAAVSDSSYTTAMDIMKAVYRTRPDAVIPASAAAEALRAMTRIRAGYDLAKASPLEAVAHSHTPTLFIHGQADSFVPPEMMPPLYRAASCPKAFLWIPEAEHVMSVVVDPETYWARVERFLHSNGVPLS